MRMLPVLAVMTVSALVFSGCGAKPSAEAIPSVAALTTDPILLSRVLDRCNAKPSAAGSAECVNARAAVDRRSADDEAARVKRAQSGFEAARESRRRADEAAQL